MIKLTMLGLLLTLSSVLVLYGCTGSGRGGVSQSSQQGQAGYGADARSLERAQQPVPAGLESVSPRRTPRATEIVASDIDEVWVIERARFDREAPAMEDDEPGSGAMQADLDPDDGEEVFVPLPLMHTGVEADVAGYIAEVGVTQRFHNPYDTKIEAVYVFPLPQDAAVHEFIMVVGERRIHGIIREREEAQRVYEEARAQGYRAAIMTQERPNIFTQKVANLEPGDDIDVQITYLHTLRYSDGGYTFMFPMVVGPRFNPPHTTDGVGAIAVGNRGASGQATEVEYLRPNERSAHDIDLSVTIDAGMPIEALACVTHDITTDQDDAGRITVDLAGDDVIPNRDFVLHYTLAGDTIKSGLVTHRDERGGFFTLMLMPPTELESLPRQPMEMVFVLDCSGSMSGRPIAQAKAAAELALTQLTPQDSFQVIRFSSDASALGPEPLTATPENIRRGRRYIRSLNSGGGTMMIEGIKAALEFPHDPERYRVVCFLTDGYIGNEEQIFAAIEPRLGDARVFSFGVGSSVNRYLMERMARIGRGTAAYVSLQDDATDTMDFFLDRAAQPAMTHLQLETFGEPVDGLTPHRLPDVFVGRPVVLTGRLDGDLPDQMVVTGRAGGQPIEVVVETRRAASHDGVALIWARHQIESLHDAQRTEPGGGEWYVTQITDLALDYGLMSRYTAFLAVDTAERTSGNFGVSVRQGVPVPEGVLYSTTVSE